MASSRTSAKSKDRSCAGWLGARPISITARGHTDGRREFLRRSIQPPALAAGQGRPGRLFENAVDTKNKRASASQPRTQPGEAGLAYSAKNLSSLDSVVAVIHTGLAFTCAVETDGVQTIASRRDWVSFHRILCMAQLYRIESNSVQADALRLTRCWRRESQKCAERLGERVSFRIVGRTVPIQKRRRGRHQNSLPISGLHLLRVAECRA